MQDVSGVSGAGPIFREVMLTLHRTHSPEPFVAPRGLHKQKVYALSGGRPGPYCQGSLPEWFSGPEP